MIEQSVEGSFSSSLVDNSLSQSESLQLRALLGESDAQWYPKFHSERLIIGDCLRDNTTQTDYTELLHVKSLTEKANQLKEERDDLLRTQNETLQSLDSAYSKTLFEQASVIYSRTNKQMEYLDNLCKKRISQVRQASRTELNDAIKKISHQYKTHYEDALQKALKSREKAKKALSLEPSFTNLINSESDTNQLSEEIERLQSQNDELKDQLEKSSINVSSSNTLTDVSALLDSQEENKKLQTVLEEAWRNLSSLQAELSARTEQLCDAEEKTHKINSQFQAELEKNQVLQIRLNDSQQKLRLQNDAHAKMIKDTEERIEHKMEEELASQKRKFDFCLKDERNIAASEMAKRDEKIEALQKIIAALENKFDRKDTPKPEATRKKISQVDITVPRSRGEPDLGEIEFLEEELRKTQRELDRSNKNWENRFNVLRASLHEIKDESFLRKRIEQQPLAVHTTQFPGPDQNEVPTPILPPLRPSLAKKSQTPIKVELSQELSPRFSEPFTSGSESENEDSDNEEFPTLKTKSLRPETR